MADSDTNASARPKVKFPVDLLEEAAEDMDAAELPVEEEQPPPGMQLLRQPDGTVARIPLVARLPPGYGGPDDDDHDAPAAAPTTDAARPKEYVEGPSPTKVTAALQ